MNKRIIITSAFVFMLGCSGAFLSSCAEKDKGTAIQQSSEVSDTETEASKTSMVKTTPYETEGMKFSARSGFYDGEFYLDIKSLNGGTVYYTLDGSTPDSESTVFTEPLLITDRSSDENILSAHKDIAQPKEYTNNDLPDSPVDKATVVRAVCIDEKGSKSNVVTNTYFIGFNDKADYYDDLKIVSLITDESNLFDYENGIYVIGKTYEDWLSSDEYDPETPDWFLPGNYTQKGREWERPAQIQFFDNGELEFAQDTGIRIHGGATRSYTQKSLNIYARKDYGASKLEYDLFSGNIKNQTDGSPITEFDTFVLRNTGNDAMFTRFRDKLIQSLVSDRQFLTQGMEPCILFINGEYWGHYEITEKLDESFIEAHYGIADNDVCIVKRDCLDEGSEETFAEWKELRNRIKNTDLSDDKEYEKLCELVDMQGFADYVCTELYIDNIDWGAPNSAMWRAQTVDGNNPYTDGKWRFILFDTEYSSGIYGEARAENDSLSRLLDKDCFITDLYKAAMKNEGFRKHFMETFADISENNFSNERVENEINALSESYHDMAIDTFNRFWADSYGGSYAETGYRESVRELSSFFSQRKKYITEYIQ